MRTAAQRIAHYNARMVSSLIDPVLTSMQTQQSANFTAYAVDFVPKQDQLRSILNGAGVSASMVFLYEAYHNELYGAYRRFAGAALTAYADVLHAKYLALGGETGLLSTIAQTIYGVTTP